MIISNAKHT